MATITVAVLFHTRPAPQSLMSLKVITALQLRFGHSFGSTLSRLTATSTAGRPAFILFQPLALPSRSYHILSWSDCAWRPIISHSHPLMSHLRFYWWQLLEPVTALQLGFSLAFRRTLSELPPPDSNLNQYYHYIPAPCTAVQHHHEPSGSNCARWTIVSTNVSIDDILMGPRGKDISICP